MNCEKQLLLIMRHAESQNPALFGRDFDRTLTPLGAEQAKHIAQQIVAQQISVDKAVISSSTRTLETWNILSKTLPPSIQLSFDKRLYQASLEVMLDVIYDNASDAGSLLILAHCPAVREAVSHLSGRMLDFATADVAVLTPRHKSIQECIYTPHQFDLLQTIRSHG